LSQLEIILSLLVAVAVLATLAVRLGIPYRCTLVRLRDEGKIGDEAMHRIERDLDLEESRLEV
jgi:hypothetical protein